MLPLAQNGPRLTLAASLVAGLMFIGPACQAASTYDIDQRYGTLGFEVDEAGLFTSKGQFHRFSGQLTLDFQRPERSRIDVLAEAGSADIPGPGAIDMLRSPDYFDTERHKLIHFVSTDIQALGGDRFHIDGTAEVRGITKPQAFDAVLTRHGEVADFLVTGRLRRSEFGMVADQDFISDTVRLEIRLELALAATP